MPQAVSGMDVIELNLRLYYHACIKNDIELAKSLISDGANDFNLCMRTACQYGHIEIAKLMIQHGANEWNGGLYYACQKGHVEAVKLMIQHGANEWNQGLYVACYGGHVEIIDIMVSHGANDFDNCLYYACRGGHVKAVKRMIRYGGTLSRAEYNKSCTDSMKFEYTLARGQHYFNFVYAMNEWSIKLNTDLLRELWTLCV